MRIDRLDLTRYGHFTDASLPFGEAGSQRPDLHIVYGDNEAGKTTTLNALMDLVFGIEPASTPYDFLHQAAALRLGGALDIGGERREVIRLPKSALLDVDERPLADGLFSLELAGLDRATYRTMFLLDEKTLAAGGESILANKGELGALLFSATAGLADFGQALGRLRGETDAFYKLHGRKHGLGDLKKELARLKGERAAIDVLAAPYARLIAARDEALSAYEEAVAARGRLQADLEAVRRHLSSLPRLAEWRSLKAEHDAMPPHPSVPPGWPEELVELQKASVALATRRAATEEEVARLAAEIDASPIDEAGLAVAARLKTAAELRERASTAAKDLPDRRAKLRAAEAAVASVLRDLGRERCQEPRELLLRPGVADRLRRSLESLSGATTALNEARSELDDARSRCEAARQAAEAVNAPAEDAPSLWELKSALAAAESDDSEARLRLAERACRLHGDVLAERLAVLRPWQGDAAALTMLDLPGQAERDELDSRLADARGRRDQIEAEEDQLSREVGRLADALKALREGGALVGDEAAAAARLTRDAAWSTHLATLDAASAGTFEMALREDDAITAARFAQANALGELQTLERSLDHATAKLGEMRRRLLCAGEALLDAEARIAERVGPFVGEGRGKPLAGFARFLAGRERALDARELLRAAEADRAFAREEAEAIRLRLAAAVHAIGIEAPGNAATDVLIRAGRALIDGQNAARALRSRHDDINREVEDRSRQAQRAERAMSDWRATWMQTLEATWLAGTADVGAVRDAVASLAELESALDRRDDLADRTCKMEADQAAFAAELAAMADRIGIETGLDARDLADRIEARAATASQTAATRAGKARDLEAAQGRLATLQPAIASTAERIAEMTGRFGAGSLDDLALAFEASRRREDLGRRIAMLEIEICGACGIADVADADAALADQDRDELERRRAELETRCEDMQERTQERFSALERARHAIGAIDGDAAAARLEEERRTVLLEIEDRTMAHLTMRAGVIAAENAIGLYRDRHRSSMMAQASNLFATLSRGAYRGLAAQSHKDGEVLVGLPAGGGSKLSTELSTATRNQLYLALRIAAYREFVKTRRPVPFVLDDVLETFDDDRAEASLALLAEMAETGQVIYLTHHRHLCAIARRVCPSAKLHDLGALR